ncbi:MAG: hypothetical protein ABIT37_19520 [Luteolibacter sp.]
MFTSPRNLEKWAWIACLGPLIYLGPVANAQNFTLQVTNSDPLGLRSVIPGGEELDFGLTEGIKGAFKFGVAATSTYDTNFFITEKNEKSELSTTLMPYFNYRSDPEGGAKVSINANYTPMLRAYLHNSDLNGVDQTGDVSLRIEGGKTLIKAFALYTQVSGADRLTGTYVTGTLLNTGVQATYQVAPRTSLMGNWTAAMSDYDTTGSVGSDIYTTDVGAYWSYTERLSFGPAIRYMVTDSDNIGTRDAIAFSFQGQYLLGERIRIMGSLGLEYAANSGGDEQSTLGPTGYLMARYEFNERWTWSNDIRYAMVPSPTQTGYIVNNLSASTVLNRNFLRDTVQFGMDYNLSLYENVGVAASNVSDENNLSAFLGYQRNFFSDRMAFNSRLSYTVNDGGTSWSQFQLMAGLTVAF